MNQNLFWPIYQQIENEFKKLSYYISIDKLQLKTYSLKIADLLLRIGSECENIASAICKNENIVFMNHKNENRSFINFNEYIEKLDSIFNLKEKTVSVIYNRISSETFDFKLIPFDKDKIHIANKENEIWRWYYAYNKIKHDRTNYFQEANIDNLINGLAALFILNIIYKNNIFYSTHEQDLDIVISKIENLSDIFQIDFTFKLTEEMRTNGGNLFSNCLLNPIKYFDIAIKSSTYIIEFNQNYKTDSNIGHDFFNNLENSLSNIQLDGSLVSIHKEKLTTDHKTKCAIIAYVNKLENPN